MVNNFHYLFVSSTTTKIRFRDRKSFHSHETHSPHRSSHDCSIIDSVVGEMWNSRLDSYMNEFNHTYETIIQPRRDLKLWHIEIHSFHVVVELQFSIGRCVCHVCWSFLVIVLFYSLFRSAEFSLFQWRCHRDFKFMKLVVFPIALVFSYFIFTSKGWFIWKISSRECERGGKQMAIIELNFIRPLSIEV